MVMMECPDMVNTLLHEFFLWEPDMSKKANNKMDTLHDTSQALKIKQLDK